MTIMLRTLATGIPEIDKQLNGGFAVDSVNLVLGGTGTGKTIFGQQVLSNYSRLHPYTKALYLTTSQQSVAALHEMENFDFYNAELFQTHVFVEDITVAIDNFDAPALIKFITRTARENHCDLVLIDAYDELREAFRRDGDARRWFFEMALELSTQQSTTILLSRWAQPEFVDAIGTRIIDSVIITDAEDRQTGQHRTMRITNLHGNQSYHDKTPFMITSDGICTLTDLNEKQIPFPSSTLNPDRTQVPLAQSHILERRTVPNNSMVLFDNDDNLASQIAVLFGKAQMDIKHNT